MNSFTTPEFWALYSTLPDDVRRQARQAYQLFQENPHHPGLRFRKVHPVRPIYSARIGISYRAVGIRQDDGITWYWIGSHANYDELLRHT